MEKHTETINFYESLPEELIPRLSSFCDDSTFAKLSLTAKKTGKEIQAAIANQVREIFKQPSSAWKKLNKDDVEKAVNVLQEEEQITALLKQIIEWTKYNRKTGDNRKIAKFHKMKNI